MPDYDLHADYDHDGRLSESAQEHALRHTRPDAVIVTLSEFELESDGLRIPSTKELIMRPIAWPGYC
jgi:hypothetical protein